MIEESGENKFGNLADNPHTKALKGISPDELSGQGILFFIGKIFLHFLPIIKLNIF